jgi:hypothetical protein
MCSRWDFLCDVVNVSRVCGCCRLRVLVGFFFEPRVLVGLPK